MIWVVFIDLWTFITIFFLAIVYISLMIKFVKNNTENLGSLMNIQECEDPAMEDYKDIINETFLLVIGTNHNDEERYGRVIFLIICFFFVVVMLNLLIAVVSDTYDKVEDGKIPLSYIQ